jgi:hypothetical protein
MSTEYIQVPGTSSQAPINIQITQPQPPPPPKETNYSKKWLHKKITNDVELGHFIKSLFIQYGVVKGIFIPINAVNNSQPRDTDDENQLNTIKKQYAKFFNFTYNIVKNKDNTTIGVSVIKKLKSKSSKINVNSINHNKEYLGAKCLTSSSSSKKNSRIPPRKWKIQLMCKFTDTPETRDLVSELDSNILSDDYTLLLSEEICDDNSGPCSITKEPSNEILQYYNNIIKNTENLLKDTNELGTFFPKIVEDFNLVVEGIPSVADIIVKLLSFSSFDKCAKTELHNILSDINMPNVTLDTLDNADNKAKIIILLSLYDDKVDPTIIQEIGDLIIPINQNDIMGTIINYIQQITLKSDDQAINVLVKQIPTRIKEYQTNSSCQSKVNESLTEFNKSVSKNTTVANNFLSTNIQNAQDALGGATETINDALPDVVKEPITKIVENVIPTNTNREDHENFVKSILALLNPSSSNEVRNIPTINEKNEEREEPKKEEEKVEPFSELVIGEKEEEMVEPKKKEEKDEESEKIKELEKEEEMIKPFGELVIGEKEEERVEPFGELVIGEKEEEKIEPFGELVIGENDIGNKPI